MVTLADVHQEIRAAIETGALLRARQLADLVLSARPQNVETRALLAEIDLESGAFRPAVDGFERVLAADPEAFLAHAGLGIAYEALRDPGGALHWYSRALDLIPSNTEVRAERDRLFRLAYPGRSRPAGLSELARARSLADMGRYRDAAEAHRKLLAREPGRTEVAVGLAEILWKMGRDRDAEGLGKHVLGAAPPAVKAKVIVACVAAQRGDVDLGRAMLAETQAFDPEGRIAGHLVIQSPLSEWVTELVELSIDLDSADSDEAVSADLPLWAGWMRHAVFRALRLTLREDAEPAIRERVVSRRDYLRRSSPRGPIGRRVLAHELPQVDQGLDQLDSADRALVSEEIIEIPAAALPVRATAPPRQEIDRQPPSRDEDATIIADRVIITRIEPSLSQERDP